MALDADTCRRHVMLVAVSWLKQLVFGGSRVAVFDSALLLTGMGLELLEEVGSPSLKCIKDMAGLKRD